MWDFGDIRPWLSPDRLLDSDDSLMTASTPPPGPTRAQTQCPQCAGSTRGVPGRQYLQCEYCSSLVFPHDNPLMTDGIIPLGDELDSSCPCCHSPLQTGEMDGNPALYCANCYGVLVRNDAFGRVIRDRRAKRSTRENVEVTPIDMAQYERILNCPSCLGKMEVHPYYGPGNVVIDSCHRCSYIWLDHSEMATMVIAGGGVEPPPSVPGELERPTRPPAGFGSQYTSSDDFSFLSVLDQLFRILD